jgi:hypothetical protein
MTTKAPRIVAITEDGSRWLLDDEFVQQGWDAYCAENGDSEFNEYDWIDHIDPDRDVMSFESWLFPNAKLVDASSALARLINTGDLLPDENTVREWYDQAEKGEYSDEYRPKYPTLELATTDDLSPNW